MSDHIIGFNYGWQKCGYGSYVLNPLSPICQSWKFKEQKLDETT